MIDCTELITDRPSSLKAQSQFYSDYKSNTTLKALIAVDSRGSVMFVSPLMTGSISDNDICVKSRFFDYLKKLKSKNFILEGDAIMADKGFRIEKELFEIGMKLNIPPFASKASQMIPSDVLLTRKIAKYRIHVERAIKSIKDFKIVSKKIPASLFHMINEIFFVCCILTNFLPILVRNE